jgi:hypothetical protein
MNDTEILRRTFAAHEHMAPDAELALDGIQHGVRTRRRSRAAVAGAVVTVAAVVVGASFLSSAAKHPAQAPAGKAPGPAPARARTAAPAPDFVTIAAGWLPSGAVQQTLLSNSFGQQVRGYNVTSGATSVYVLVGIEPRTASPIDHKRGTPREFSVNGRQATEWSVDDWYDATIVLSDGQEATVEIAGGANQGKGGDGSAAALAAIGRRVAAHLELQRHDSINPSFALSYVPRGLVVRAVSRDAQNGTSYTVAGAGAHWSETMPNYATVSESRESTQPQRGSGTKKGDPLAGSTHGRAVQGHRTLVSASGEVPTLWVTGVRPGVSIVLNGGPGVTSLAELYRIADGLILGS